MIIFKNAPAFLLKFAKKYFQVIVKNEKSLFKTTV